MSLTKRFHDLERQFIYDSYMHFNIIEQYGNGGTRITTTSFICHKYRELLTNYCKELKKLLIKYIIIVIAI